MKKYKKFVLNFILTGLILAAVLPLYFMGLGYLVGLDYFDEIYADKISTLENSKDKNRILIDAGSGTRFSINARDIEKELGIFTINLGDYAGVPLEYKIYRLAKTAHKGDLIVLPLEYKYYLDDFTTKHVVQSLLSGHYNTYFSYFPLFEKIKIAYSFSLADNAQSIKKAKKNLKMLIKDENFSLKKANLDSVADLIKNRGDFDYNEKNFPPGADVKIPCFQYIFRDNFKGKIDERFIKNLKSLQNLSQKTGAKVVFTYPNVNGKACYDFSADGGEEFKNFLSDIKILVKSYGFDFIGDYKDSYFDDPDKYMLDTQYHLNKAGRALRSAQLAKTIGEYIKTQKSNNIKD